MPTVKLTPGFCLTAAPPTKGDRIVYWDSSIVGFGLAVTNTGHKSWVVTYRAKHQQRRMSLNSILTLTEARKEEKALLGDVARGGDPLEVRRRSAADASTTLRAIAEDYLKREAVKLRTRGERTRVLEKLVYP